MLNIHDVAATSSRQTKNPIDKMIRDISNNGYLSYAKRPRRRIFNIVAMVQTIKMESVQSRLRRIGLDITKIKVKDIA
jgi:hypothetical protein